MLGFFESKEKRMRDNASNWLELASKVWSYRRDELGEREAGELQGRTQELRGLLRERADAGRLKAAIEALEAVLVRTGAPSTRRPHSPRTWSSSSWPRS